MTTTRKPLPILTGNEKNLGFLYLIFQLFLLPELLRLLGGMFSFEISGTLSNFIFFSVNFVCILVIFSRFLLKSVLRCRRCAREIAATAIVGFLAYWLCITLLGMVTAALFPDFVNLNDSTLIGVLGNYPVLMFLGTVILAPVAEEVLHRGLVFGTLVPKSVPLAYCGSALLFAAIHVLQYIGLYSPGYLLLALVQYLPAGLILAWAYRQSGCILAPVLIHAANNAIAISMTR